MGSSLTRPAVLGYLIKHPGELVSLADLMQVTGFSATQIQSQMRNLIAEDYPLTVIARAQIWKYTGDAKPELKDDGPDNRVGEVWEVVGHTKSGVILRDEFGTLYRTTEME